MHEALVLKGNIVYTASPESFTIKKNSYLVAESGHVKGIYEQLPEQYSTCDVKDYGEHIIMPGFVDLHIHGAQYLQRGMGMDKQLLDWLNGYTYDSERKYGDEAFATDIYGRFVKDLARCGTTRSAVFATSSLKGTEILIETFKKIGLGAYVGKVDMDRNAPAFLIQPTDASISETAYLIDKYKDEEDVKIIITPRFAITSTEAQLEGLGELAVKHEVPVQSHLSESHKEIETVLDLFPECKSYSEVYDKYRLFGQTPTLMAHGIHLSDEELDLIKKNEVVLVHCPDSNINLRSGIMPVKKYLSKGIKVGLGSDVAAGHKIAMNEAIVRAIQMSKLYSIDHPEGGYLSLEEAFYMATKGGGSFFGEVGSFEEGYKLDCLIVKIDEDVRDMFSLEDHVERFIYTGDDRDILDCYVSGKKIEV